MLHQIFMKSLEQEEINVNFPRMFVVKCRYARHSTQKALFTQKARTNYEVCLFKLVHGWLGLDIQFLNVCVNMF